MRMFNLASRRGLVAPCDRANLKTWLAKELTAIEHSSVRDVVEAVCSNLDDFVLWPERALLLWQGCDRVTPEGKKQRIHKYPVELKRAVSKIHGFDDWDTRPNGPAIAAYIVAGGPRPARHGSFNAWSIHHLYSGKFPHHEGKQTIHAKKNGAHFTQSAGLVAVHPIADAICDEFPFFSWLLRAHAFERFGYDPDQIFCLDGHDEFGFVLGKSSPIIY